MILATNKKPVIAVDCDDVILPTAAAVLRHYNATYNTDIPLKDFYSTDLVLWNAPDAATAIHRVEAFLTSDTAQNITPLPGAVAVLQKLSERYELHIVTGRTELTRQATDTMLARHFPRIFRSVQFTSFGKAGQRSKSEVCVELGASYLIDDHLHHTRVAAGCGVPALLFGVYPWNTLDGPLPAGVERVSDWSGVARRLLGIRP